MKKTTKLLLFASVFLVQPYAPAAESTARQIGDDHKASTVQHEASISAEGTVYIPTLAVPLSAHMSDEAKRRFIKKFRDTAEGMRKLSITQAQNQFEKDESISASGCALRESLQNRFRPLIERAKAVYPVVVEEQMIAGVRTDVVTPKVGIPARNRNRVLINLHGGGFSCATGGGWHGVMESVPIAGVGKFKVIAVDYRTSPEYKFPAASEDVAAVYKELLKSHKPENIGIYGCSTGATLSAGSVAWFQKEQLPRPGAIGLFGDGATKDDHVDGDGWFINVALTGDKILAPGQSHQALYPEPYMSGADYNDPLVAPVVSAEVLSKFPPTLVISGTRDLGLSEALYTHTQLVKVGAEAELHVWEGMWHCFFFDVDLPESKEEFDVVTRFFDRHLGRK